MCPFDRVNHHKRLSHQPGQLWAFLPSGNITFNIYKPLNRINHKGSGGALLPITSARPPGFVTEPFNGHTEGFQSRCFGTRPLLKLGWAEEDGGPEAKVGTTLRTNATMWLSTLFVPGAEKVGLGESADDCGRGFACVPQAIVALAPRWPGLANIHASSVETAAGGEEF